ncbi:membrane dipeptidase [Paraburkholderia nemoris]|uniref:membrane dipeptidase n=1 Tax=Paraburkholderia nemoris TaxID=2793076 RepID=UPI0038B7AB30
MRAADTSTKPLVLSHSALATQPSARSRLITPDHARVIAGTGGVIGVWPSSGTFHDLHAMAAGVKRMADVVGVEHVGLGTDMLGFISPRCSGATSSCPLWPVRCCWPDSRNRKSGQFLEGIT